MLVQVDDITKYPVKFLKLRNNTSTIIYEIIKNNAFHSDGKTTNTSYELLVYWNRHSKEYYKPNGQFDTNCPNSHLDLLLDEAAYKKWLCDKEIERLLEE